MTYVRKIKYYLAKDTPEHELAEAYKAYPYCNKCYSFCSVATMRGAEMPVIIQSLDSTMSLVTGDCYNSFEASSSVPLFLIGVDARDLDANKVISSVKEKYRILQNYSRHVLDCCAKPFIVDSKYCFLGFREVYDAEQISNVKSQHITLESSVEIISSYVNYDSRTGMFYLYNQGKRVSAAFDIIAPASLSKGIYVAASLSNNEFVALLDNEKCISLKKLGYSADLDGVINAATDSALELKLAEAMLSAKDKRSRAL